MGRYIFARPRPTPWRRGARWLGLIVAGTAPLCAAAAVGWLLSQHVGPTLGIGALRPPLPVVGALTRSEKDFLVAEAAKDACKYAVLTRVKYPAEANRAAFYRANVSYLPEGRSTTLRVTGRTDLLGDTGTQTPHQFSCDIRDGRIVRVALVPTKDGARRRSG